ncbi:manganese-dependent ADP-ribose/CDP-alcohol diphosphatase isoform X1 [Myxocyprinus asiaticus]|uniref:manganese-dependent ADP-ribose/CDP-alcohol diphosphatase isoform X1 n=1 Tax=Myxocyprinus asiaticus TaxID=70543 RepID=UPI002223A968|nr:manganese-dependent ADP-ribose/CDP-alcohol diphosphatase isoform X1 [Myxocyprinus asiaticus]
MERPVFTFGIIADIQYADIDDGLNFLRTRRRYYRNSLQLLRNAIQSWNEEHVKPGFILQLGDIIDGYNKNYEASDRALETVVSEFNNSSIEVHHVWGNHEFYNFSRKTLFASPVNSGAPAETGSSLIGDGIYAYHFSPAPKFRFVVLDAYDTSIIGRDPSSEKYNTSMKLLKEHNTNPDLNIPPVYKGLDQRFVKFNGGFSQEQLVWLDEVLSLADQKHEKVTIVSHLPVHPNSTDPVCLAWNYDAMLSNLHSHKSVVCFMAGHDHDGGYHRDLSGIHHLTLEGVIETSPDSNAFGTVYVYEDQMVLKGNGRISDRNLKYP